MFKYGFLERVDAENFANSITQNKKALSNNKYFVFSTPQYIKMLIFKTLDITKNQIRAHNKFFSSPSVDVIEASTKIVGDIVSKADFRIDGVVEGNITTSGKVVIGKSGKVLGKLNCSNADISGSISGQIHISETLSLMSESYIQGDITTAKLSVEEGAQVDATIVMKTGKQLKAVENNDVNEKKSDSEKTAQYISNFCINKF